MLRTNGPFVSKPSAILRLHNFGNQIQHYSSDPKEMMSPINNYSYTEGNFFARRNRLERRIS